ncbi:hypothetical protein ACFVYF_27920 [Streptomyces sp. NPDC058274]|uniref:hypothetical protein n=1 Tax=Streptomyces sp. NPDC058274 TaxID=3346416 RepID=UPI0036E33355
MRGPRFGGTGTPARGARGGAEGVRTPYVQGVRALQTPARQAPGDPVGVLRSQSAVDSGTSRHGDPHAVTLIHRVPLRLVPGAPVAVTVGETRDRHRDIREFPG